MPTRAVPSSIEGLKQWFEDSVHDRESNFFNHIKEYHEFLQKIDQLEKSERSSYYEDNDS